MRWRVSRYKRVYARHQNVAHTKVYTDKDRYSIGKYASCHGIAASARARKRTYPNLNESTVRGFKKRYEDKLKEASRRDVSPKKKLANKMRERPTLLGQKLDTLVQKLLRATRYKSGVANTQTALATAKAIVKRYPLLEKINLVLGAPWAKSLFRRMGFVLRRKTTATVLIPEGALKEAELKFHHQIVNYVEKYQIPTSKPTSIRHPRNTSRFLQIQWKIKGIKTFQSLK